MSVWNDIRKKSLGLEERKEDMYDVYFKLNSKHTFKPNERVIFNKGTSCECVGEYVARGRIDGHPIFKLIKGNMEGVKLISFVNIIE